MGLEQRDVGAAILGVADAVEQDLEVGEAQRLCDPPAEVDHFGVERGVAHADGFDAELRVLAEAAGLRSLVTEDGQVIGELDRLGLVGHAVLQVGAADGGGAFGP